MTWDGENDCPTPDGYLDNALAHIDWCRSVFGHKIGNEPLWSDAVFEETTDPFSQEVSVLAYWRGKARFGKATFFPDGRIFAEYQVLLPHPEKADSYVDSVQIWGRPPQLRGEAVIAEYLK